MMSRFTRKEFHISDSKNTSRNIIEYCTFIILSLCVCSLGSNSLFAEGEPLPTSAPSKKDEATLFEPFTGKITKGKVRLRVGPTFDAPVLQELSKGDLIVVTGETEDFFKVQPPSDLKGYVFRTYVLDNVIEGEKVNVRLKPDKEATIIAQLKTGDKVNGIVCQQNNKWVEIELPKTVRLYISKDFIEKVGNASFKDQLEKREKHALKFLQSTYEMSQKELQKPFDQINLADVQTNYQHIINENGDFPTIVEKAKEYSENLQKAYTDKKVNFLEEQNHLSNKAIETNKQLATELAAHKNKILELEQQIEQNRYLAPSSQAEENASFYQKKISGLPVNMSQWIPVEESLFQAWSEQTGKNSPQEFYNAESSQGFIVEGIIDPYTRQVKNKPGDYLLLSSGNKLPSAFLYSTTVNLQDHVGHEVSLFVVPRNNNNFAFPAYFVLKIVSHKTEK